MTEEELKKETNTNNRKEWAYFQLGRSGSFATALCRAFELGDMENRNRLRTAFPLLFETADKWYFADDPDILINKIMEGE